MNPNTPISDIMTTTLVTITPDTSLSRMHELFAEHGFHHIPVLEKNRLVGIVSKQDYLQVRNAISYNWDGSINTIGQFSDFTTADIMTEYPMHLSPDDSVGLAADIFLANKFHALPILEDDELVGLITTHDLIAYAFESPVEAID